MPSSIVSPLAAMDNTQGSRRRVELLGAGVSDEAHGSIKLGGSGARHVSSEIFILFRCVREARDESEEKARFELNASVLIEDLPKISDTIRDKSLKQQARGKAIARLSHALAYVAETQELILLSQFDKTDVLGAIVSLCHEASAGGSDLFILGNGLSVLSNVAFMNQTELVTKAGAASLLVRLLYHEKPSAQVCLYAIQTLSNLVADPIGVSAFTLEERAQVLAGLEWLSATGDKSLQAYVPEAHMVHM